MRHRCRLFPAVWCGMLFITPVARPQDGAWLEGAIRQLKVSVTSQRDGSHLPRLASLRQLRDPALAPVFRALVDRDEWQTQVHAALGLAELAAPPELDPALIGRLAPFAQEAVIAHAIDEDWLDVARLHLLLEVDSLSATARLLLLGELILLSEPVDADLIPPAGAEELRDAALAASLAARLGDEGRLETFVNRLTGVSREVRNQHLMLLLDMVRQYEVAGAAPWLASILADGGLHRAISERALLALIMLDPIRGLEAWRERLGDDPSQSQRVRSALLLLSSTATVPPETYDVLLNQDPLVQALVSIGRALASDNVESSHFITLIDVGHRRSTEWAMVELRTQPADLAVQVYRHLLGQLVAGAHAPAQQIALAVESAGALMELDPRLVLEELAGAEDDGVLQQSIMLALFNSHNPAVGRAVARIPRIGMDRADGLALVLLARHASSLEADDLEDLALLASGGGRLSDALRTQAAWLCVKHAGLADAALRRILPSPSADPP